MNTARKQVTQTVRCMKCGEKFPIGKGFPTGFDCKVGDMDITGFSCVKCVTMCPVMPDVYMEYMDILDRCYDPEHPRFQKEGAKGIEVCKQWQASFWQFAKDMVPKLNKVCADCPALKKQSTKNCN